MPAAKARARAKKAKAKAKAKARAKARGQNGPDGSQHCRENTADGISKGGSAGTT
jgi:hypothetical protein